MLYLSIAVVVVVVLLVAFVVLPTLSTSSTGGGPAVLTYSGARPIADRAVAGFQGGGWTLLFAGGFVSATNESFPANSTALGNITQYCTFTPVADIVALTLPGFSGNRSSGQSPAWEFGYRNSSDDLAIVSVINGQGQVLATISGLECTLLAQAVTAVPGNAIDSSQATAAIQPKAAAFLSAHPSASAEFALSGAYSFPGVRNMPAEWSILYNTCPLSTSATGTGDRFNATVNAVTGAVLGTNTTSDVSCGG